MKSNLKAVSIVSSKINMLINYQLIYGAVAYWIRQATNNTWN